MDEQLGEETGAATAHLAVHAIDQQRRSIIWIAPALACAISAMAIVTYYPIQPLLFGAALLGYAIALWRWQWLWLLVVPTVTPAVDLTFWTGLIDVSEADAVFLVTLAVLFYKAPPRRGDIVLGRWVETIFVLGILSYLISMVLGVMPIPGVPEHSANPYLDFTNALRVAKGFILPLLLLPFFAREIRGRKNGFELFAFGMLGGLALVCAAGMLERKLFVGFFDFNADYRIVSTFSSMHIGGGHIGTYLAMTLPFLAIAFLHRPKPFVLVGLAVLASFGGLTLIVTFARAGYLAAAAGLIILALLWLAGQGGRGHFARLTALRLFIVVIIGLTALVAISQNGFMAQRFSQALGEYATRTNNWRDGLSVRDGGLRALLFGMGLGTYPRVFAARNRGDEKGTGLQLAADNGQKYLTIIDRSRFYFAQRVPVQPDRSYQVYAKVRTDKRRQSLDISLCENVLLFSKTCSGAIFQPPLPGQWASLTSTLSTNGFDDRRVFKILGRPIELSLSVPVGTTIQVADLHLTGPDGEELLANGDFSEGLRRWLFHDDGHQAWRIQNQYLNVLFEQGWLGLIFFVLLLTTAIIYSARVAIAGNAAGAITAASLTAFAIAGIPDNLTEAPRLAMIFFLICFAAFLLPSPAIDGRRLRRDIASPVH